jgi:hypothetical protein
MGRYWSNAIVSKFIFIPLTTNIWVPCVNLGEPLLTDSPMLKEALPTNSLTLRFTDRPFDTK